MSTLRVAVGGRRSSSRRLSPAGARALLLLMLLATGALLIHETSGTTIWFDEWAWALHRRGGSLASFLDTHDGHLSLVPVAIYKVLFATVGLRSWAPYRVIVILSHLACCTLVFAYLRRRAGEGLALVAAVILLTFGPGWEDLLWPFQIAWNLSVAAGILALIALERRDRAGDLLACGSTAIALASSGIGIPVALGVAAELLLARGPLRRAWILAVPVALYAAWWIAYQHAGITGHGVLLAPSFMARGLAATVAALAGLSGSTGFDGQGTLLSWGAPLGVLAAGAAVLAVRRRRPGQRAISLLVIVLSFWALTAVSRVMFGNPYASRYLYVSAVFTLLAAGELVAGWRLRPAVIWLVTLLALAAVVSNLEALRNAGRLLQYEGQATRADLAALDIARGLAPPGYLAQGMPGFPFVTVPATAYYALERSLGTPAYSPAALSAAPEAARLTADGELIHMHRLWLVGAAHPAVSGVPPRLAASSGGTARTRGACEVFLPDAFSAPSTPPALAVAVRSGQLVIQSGIAAATVAVRRFASEFQTLGTLAPGHSGVMVLAPDGASAPWVIQVQGRGPLRICTAGH